MARKLKTRRTQEAEWTVTVAELSLDEEFQELRGVDAGLK